MHKESVEAYIKACKIYFGGIHPETTFFPENIFAQEVRLYRIEDKLREGKYNHLLDISNVNHIESGALRRIVSATETCREHDGNIVLADPQRDILYAFCLSPLLWRINGIAARPNIFQTLDVFLSTPHAYKGILVDHSLDFDKISRALG